MNMKKQIISGLSGLAGAAAGAIATAVSVRRTAQEALDRENFMSEKHLAMFLTMNRWLQMKQEGKNLADYLKEQNYRRIAIYGMSYMGERLLEELKGSEISIAYGIDKNAGGICTDIETVTPKEELKEVDAVIVTSIYFIDEITRDLSGKLSCPILSLEDILYEL